MCLCTAMMFQPNNNVPKNNKLKRWEKFVNFLKARAKRLKKYNLENNG
jgi:hypothetical protein